MWTSVSPWHAGYKQQVMNLEGEIEAVMAFRQRRNEVEPGRYCTPGHRPPTRVIIQTLVS